MNNLRPLNKDSLPTWIVDFYDGTLNDIEIARLLTFLDNHPESKKDFEDWPSAPTSICHSEVHKPLESNFIQILKKTEEKAPYLERLDWLAFEKWEGDWSESKEIELNQINATEAERAFADQLKIRISEPMPSLNWPHLYKQDIFPEEKITPETLTLWCIAAMEAQLTPYQNSIFQEYIHFHPEAEGEKKRVMDARLKPDFEIELPDSNYIKRKNKLPRHIYFYRATAIAASIAVIYMLSIMSFPILSPEISNEMATKSNKIQNSLHHESQIKNFSIGSGAAKEMKAESSPKKIELAVARNEKNEPMLSSARKLQLVLINPVINTHLDIRKPNRPILKINSNLDSSQAWMIALREMDEPSIQDQFADKFNRFFQQPVIASKSVAGKRKHRLNYGLILEKATQYITRNTPLNLWVTSKKEAEEEGYSGIVVGEYQVISSFR